MSTQHAVAKTAVFSAHGFGRRLPMLGSWALGFAPLVVLGFSGGGYDTILRSQFGIAVWWLVAVGCLAGAFTPSMPSKRALAAALLLAALGVWSLVDITASASSERTLVEVGRIATYLGVFLLALMSLNRERAPMLVLGVASAIGLIALLAVLSRVQPQLLPANETGQFLQVAQQRLNWPLNYWNGLAALSALGVPLLLALAAGHSRVLVRGLAAAGVPVLLLCIDLTISRGGIVAASIGALVLLALAPRRMRLLASMGITGTASALLIAAASQRGLLHQDLVGSVANEQGDELTVVLLIVVAGAALLQVGVALFDGLRVPAPSRISPRQARAATVTVVLLAVIVGYAAGAPSRLSDAWSDFKNPALERDLASDNSPSRLGSLSSNGRYELWRVAANSLRAEPVSGTGPGTFEFTWLQNTPVNGTVRDAHSFFLELGAEAGVPGALLGVLFVLALFSAAWNLRRLPPATRFLVAGVSATVVAFAVSAAVDWVWEVPVVPVTVLLVAAAGFATTRAAPADGDKVPRSPWLRAAVALAVVAPIALLSLVLASASSVEQSRASAQSGSLPVALKHAIDAHALDPEAATPLLQSALIREQAGDVRGATADARQATRSEPANWRTWLVLSRLEATSGRPEASVAAFRRARDLNPRSSIFRR